MGEIPKFFPHNPVFSLRASRARGDIFQVSSVDIAFADVRNQESRKTIFVRWGLSITNASDEILHTKTFMGRFHEQDLRMSVWRGRAAAKKAGLYMEEWLTALRFRSIFPRWKKYLIFREKLFVRCRQMKRRGLLKEAYTE